MNSLIIKLSKRGFPLIEQLKFGDHSCDDLGSSKGTKGLLGFFLDARRTHIVSGSLDSYQYTGVNVETLHERLRKAMAPDSPKWVRDSFGMSGRRPKIIDVMTKGERGGLLHVSLETNYLKPSAISIFYDERDISNDFRFLESLLNELANPTAEESVPMLEPRDDQTSIVVHSQSGSTGGEQQGKSQGMVPAVSGKIVGRDTLIEKLRGDFLAISRRSESERVHVLTAFRGLFGVGKTTLASCLANDAQIAAEFPTVLWTSLGHLRWNQRNSSLQRVLEAWSQSIDGPPLAKCFTLEDASRTLTGYLRDKSALIVVDDVWNREDMQPLVVGGARCLTIVTTRDNQLARTVADPNNVHDIPCLSDEDSLELLRVLAPNVAANHKRQCLGLARAVEGLPLALQIAGRQLCEEAERGNNIEATFTALQSPARIISSDVFDLMGGTMSYATRQTVSAIIARSTDTLEPTLVQRFAILASFGRDTNAFGLSLLSSLWQTNDTDARTSIGQLADRGLVTALGNERFRLHTLIAAHAQELLRRINP